MPGHQLTMQAEEPQGGETLCFGVVTHTLIRLR